MSVQLGSAGALALGMAIHELTTNAVKYGSLSVPDGQTDIAWAIDGEGSQAALSLQWNESGGPAVSEPQHIGFGTTLIRRSFSDELDGDADLNFHPGGLQARSRALLVRISRGLPSTASGDRNG